MNDGTTSVWRSAFMSFVLAALVWVVYSNALHGPFVFDDLHVIPENPSVQNIANIPAFFTDVTQFSVLIGNQGYRPVFLTSMAVAWWLGDGETWPFHAISITLHAANAILLFLIARILLQREVGIDADGRARQADMVAFAAAALFAVHPLATESVSYISSQSVPLAALFYLLSFWAFVTIYFSGRSPARWIRIACLALAYGSFALALLSKPIAITLPVNLVLCDLVFGRSFKDRGDLGWFGQAKRLWKHLPFWALSILYLVVRGLVSNTPFGSGATSRSAVIHYMTETKALVFYYLKLFVAPFGQNVDREYALVTSAGDVWFLVAVLTLAVALVVVIVLRRHRNLVFWAFWFPVCLSVTTYAVILGQVVNEHRVYLSLAGLCVVAAYLFSRLMFVFPVSISDLQIGRRSGAFLTGALAILIIAGLSQRTIARNETWSSELALWEDAATNGGTWRAHMNYGLALERAGRQDEALAQFEEAVRLGRKAFAYLNLGNAQMRRGNHDEGLKNLRTAVRLWPTSPETRLFLALGLSRIGEAEAAEAEFKKALELRPNYLQGHRHLAEFYRKQARYDEAIDVLQNLQGLTPDQPWIAEQIAQLERSPASNDQGHTDRLFQAAFANQKAGRLDRAIEGYETLLRSAPNHRQATFNLAYAYLQDGPGQNLKRSDELFERVLVLDPDYTEALYHIATANWKAGNEAKAAEFDRAYLKRGTHRQLRASAEQRLAKVKPGQ